MPAAVPTSSTGFGGKGSGGGKKGGLGEKRGGGSTR